MVEELEMWEKLFPIIKVAAWGDKGQDFLPLWISFHLFWRDTETYR